MPGVPPRQGARAAVAPADPVKRSHLRNRSRVLGSVTPVGGATGQTGGLNLADNRPSIPPVLPVSAPRIGMTPLSGQRCWTLPGGTGGSEDRATAWSGLKEAQMRPAFDPCPTLETRAGALQGPPE